MCVHGSQAVYSTTELCLSVDKLKEDGKTNNNWEGTMLVYRGDVYVVYILSTVKTENTYKVDPWQPLQAHLRQRQSADQ